MVINNAPILAMNGPQTEARWVPQGVAEKLLNVLPTALVPNPNWNDKPKQWHDKKCRASWGKHAGAGHDKRGNSEKLRTG
jgi:hypothetical protein